MCISSILCNYICLVPKFSGKPKTPFSKIIWNIKENSSVCYFYRFILIMSCVFPVLALIEQVVRAPSLVILWKKNREYKKYNRKVLLNWVILGTAVSSVVLIKLYHDRPKTLRKSFMQNSNSPPTTKFFI